MKEMDIKRERGIEIVDFATSDYEEILRLQTCFFDELVEAKKAGSVGQEYLLAGEHPPVITLGRRAKQENILEARDILSARGVGVYATGRGGDVTYHAPGQLILYPILDLERHHLGVKGYVDLLEESVMRLLETYGIKGERVEGATGVWIGKDTSEERKICAIGVKCSHFCTMHGLALNVNTDLSGFGFINPCGFKDKGVTSMKKELGHEVDFEKVKQQLLHIFLGLIFSF